MDKCEIIMVGDGAKDPKPNDNSFSTSDLNNLLLDKREAVSIFSIELSHTYKHLFAMIDVQHLSLLSIVQPQHRRSEVSNNSS